MTVCSERVTVCSEGRGGVGTSRAIRACWQTERSAGRLIQGKLLTAHEAVERHAEHLFALRPLHGYAPCFRPVAREGPDQVIPGRSEVMAFWTRRTLFEDKGTLLS